MSGFGNFTQNLPQAVRRAVLELKRLIQEVRDTYLPLSGGTVTGALTVKNVLRVDPDSHATEGGEIQLMPGTSGAVTWNVDNTSDVFRIHEGGAAHVQGDPNTHDWTMIGGLYVEDGGTAANPTGLVVQESDHATSNRSRLRVGNWELGQDSSLNGTRNGYLYNTGSAGFALVFNAATNQLEQLGAGWQSYTPQVWQGAGTPNVSKTVTFAQYMRIGGLCVVQVRLAITGSGTAGQLLNIQLPFAPSLGGQLGTMHISDLSTVTRYVGSAEYNTSGSIHGVIFVNSASGFSGWGATPNLAIANGDGVDLNLSYRIS